MRFLFEFYDVNQIDPMIRKLNAVPGVFQVRRTIAGNQKTKKV